MPLPNFHRPRFDFVVFATLLLFCSLVCRAQVPVAMAPPIHFQFLNASGQTLANGKIYTYQAGTTTCLNTYVDATGTTQNPCPILLDSTGSPSNGSVETGIFLANNSYKFVAYDQNNVFQWSVDNISTYFGLLNTANVWGLPQTFSGQIIDTLTDNQIVLGASGNQTTLDAPPPSGNITLHFPATGDTLVGQNTTDTLTNKTLTAPTINNAIDNSPTETTPTVNSVEIVDSPGTYLSIANATPTGTTAGSLVKLINAPSVATIAAVTDLAGIVGICALNCGNSGNAVVQASGTVNCLFDGAVTANDYVTISSTTAGDCHDAGANYPSLTQVLGRVLVTNASGGFYSIVLYGSDVKIPGSALGIVQIPNAGTTGTTVNTLTKLTGAPSSAVIAATSDNGAVVVGITTGGAGTTGNAQVQQTGLASCVFDGATTAGHYVNVSTTTAGNCHDVGAVPGGIGIVQSTNGSAGTYQVLLQPYHPQLQIGSAAGCVSSGSACSTTVTWTFSFIDTTYSANCWGIGPVTGNPQPAFVYPSTLNTGSVVASTDNRGTTNNGGYTTIDCRAERP
jgi:hypothetical protein